MMINTHEVIWASSLTVALVITAALVNRFIPATKSRLRPITILLILYFISLAGYHVLEHSGEPDWARRVLIAAQVMRVLVVVSLAGTLIFRLALRGIGVVVPTIASDLLVGIAYIIAVVGVFSEFGLDPLSAVATGAAVSAILAFSLQSTLGNILGGVALQLDGSIHEGDWIQLENGKQGKIRAIRWRHTLLETRDWSTIVVPNALLLASNITILGYRDGAPAPQRMWVYFNVDFRHPPGKVIEAVTNGLLAAPIENVAADPKPNCICMDFAKDTRDSFAYYAVRYWLIDLAVDDPTSSRVRQRIYTALTRAGIQLAIPAVTNFVEIQDREREKTHDERLQDQRFSLLRTVHLFAPLTDDELRVINHGITTTIYTKGETITRQGATAHYLYVLVRGSVEIRSRKDGKAANEHRLIAELDAPEVFGEMGLMTGAPRGADVIAKTDVECYRIDKPTFSKVLTERPEIAKELADKLASRRANNDKLAHLTTEQRKKHHENEAARILGGIKDFFGL
ncbi:MAG: mechanosensitive ion channel family protein [Kofleriaceae bacterium]